jgi:predicted ester cyclase
MSEQLTNDFVSALRTLEATKDAAPLTALYSSGAKSGNVIAPNQFEGPGGALQFWTEYRGAFGDAKSEFHNIIVGPQGAALEWTTIGTSIEGKPVQYSGVTLLEMNEQKITRSCAYFDPGGLGRQMTSESSE